MERKIQASGEQLNTMGDREKNTVKSSKYLYAWKDTEHGCGPKSHVERVLSFNIPIEDPDAPKELNAIKYNETD